MTTTIEASLPTDTSADRKPPRTIEQRKPGLATALRSEWVKLATVRSPRVITALTIVVGGFAAFAVARFVTDEVITVANVFGFSAVFTAVFAAVNGILIHTEETEYRTIHQTFAAEPRRGVVVAAKAGTAAGFSALLGFSGLAAGAVGAWLAGVDLGDTSDIPTTIAWAIGFSVLASILGLGIGLIARQSTAAISGLLIWWLVIENLVSVFASEQVVRFMPFVAGNGMLEIVDEGEPIAFDRPITALIFASYAAAALLIGTAAVHRTDP